MEREQKDLKFLHMKNIQSIWNIFNPTLYAINSFLSARKSLKSNENSMKILNSTIVPERNFHAFHFEKLIFKWHIAHMLRMRMIRWNFFHFGPEKVSETSHKNLLTLHIINIATLGITTELVLISIFVSVICLFFIFYPL